MKTFASLALAGTLALAALVPSIEGASADGRRWDDRWDRRHHHDHYNGGGWNGGDSFLAGTALGLTFGALASPAYPAPYGYYDYPPPPPRPYYRARASAHIDWCSARYESYSAEDNTWVDYYGAVHECIGPY